ncbi:hypothetical protein Tco_1412424 [Tanacetum coccineum]
MVERTKLDEDLQGTTVDPTHYNGLWYSKDISIALTAYADADHAGCQDTRNCGFEFNKIPLYYDTRVLLLFAVTMSSTQDQIILMSSITLSKKTNKKMVWIELYYRPAEYQLQQASPKALPKKDLKLLINNLGMKSVSPETLKTLVEENEE